MRFDPKQYATALYELTRGLDGKQLEDTVRAFVRELIRNGDLALAGKIASLYAILWLKRENAVEVRVRTPKKLGSEAREQVMDFAQELSGAASAELYEEIDKSLIGGAVIRFGDRMIDASIQNRLQALREKLAA